MECLITPALPVATAPVNLAEAIQGKPRGVRWRNYLIVGTVILVLSLGGAYWWRQAVKARNPWVPYVTESLRRGDIQLTITATGNLAPTTEVTVQFQRADQHGGIPVRDRRGDLVRVHTRASGRPVEPHRRIET